MPERKPGEYQTCGQGLTESGLALFSRELFRENHGEKLYVIVNPGDPETENPINP